MAACTKTTVWLNEKDVLPLKKAVYKTQYGLGSCLMYANVNAVMT